ncbi:MAG: hypothetical protein DMF49_08410 [Acidobacteria bacterium]|nr:MAG: hypothetical protein DMF49_08410 [Acidobacteriota bacterium]
MNPDFKDMLSALSEEGVEFLVVGAYALAAHGIPMATGAVRSSESNAERCFSALRRFGAPLGDLTRSDLTAQGTVFQIGVAPNRIDLLTSIDAVAFDEAWTSRITVRIEGLDVPVIGREHLLRNKRATGRPRDLADAERIEGRD